MSDRKATISQQQVQDYLADNPDALADLIADQPGLIDGLTRQRLNGDDALVDFQQVRIDALRQALDEREGHHEELVDTSRSNLASQHQIHAAVLDLMQCRSLEELVAYVSQEMPDALRIDAAILCVESRESRGPFLREPVRNVPSGGLTTLFPTGSNILLGSPSEATADIFGPAATLIKSHALIQMVVGQRETPAMLALGDRDEARFHQGQATHLLRFFGDALAARIGHFLADSSDQYPPQWSTPE